MPQVRFDYTVNVANILALVALLITLVTMAVKLEHRLTTIEAQHELMLRRF